MKKAETIFQNIREICLTPANKILESTTRHLE